MEKAVVYASLKQPVSSNLIRLAKRCLWFMTGTNMRGHSSGRLGGYPQGMPEYITHTFCLFNTAVEVLYRPVGVLMINQWTCSPHMVMFELGVPYMFILMSCTFYEVVV